LSGTLLREVKLESNIMLSFYDRSRHYYGGFYQVTVNACCELPLCADYCTDADAYAEVFETLGETIRFSRNLERMGVLEADIPDVSQQLIDRFIETALSYINDPLFPKGLVAAEMEKVRRQRIKPVARFSC
jgi:hypothetical protein